jgi:hypothetical protein
MREQISPEQKGRKVGTFVFFLFCSAILVVACTVPVRMSNERDAENKPIPLLTTLDGKATTTDETGKRTETVFHPAEVKPVPTPGFDWMTALLPLAGLIPGIGGALALVLPKLLAARAAVKEVVDGVQDWKSDMPEKEKAEFNATLAAKQSKKTKDIIAKHKGKT